MCAGTYEVALATHGDFFAQLRNDARLNASTCGNRRALPQQVSVLGFDDFVVGMDGFSWATMFSPKVSCVAQPSYEVGRRAAQALLKKTKKIDGQDHSEEGFIRLRAELRIRESTAPPPSL